MSRTIVTNSGSHFLSFFRSEKLIGHICKEVGGKYFEDFDGPVMAYEMTEVEVNDICIELSNFLTRERYFRFFEKHKHFFSKDSTIYTFVSFVEGLINDLRDSKGYECI
jgi:hypothetical protein